MVKDPDFVAACDKRHVMLDPASGEEMDAIVKTTFALPRLALARIGEMLSREISAHAAGCFGERMYRLVVADLDSPSYFVATAAVELGFFREEGIDAEVERAYGALNGPERLRNGEVHFLGGPAYMATRAFPGWKGVKLLCALAQYSYWFLAVRADLDVRRGDVEALKGLRISSSTAFPEVGLRHLLKQAWHRSGEG